MKEKGWKELLRMLDENFFYIHRELLDLCLQKSANESASHGLQRKETASPVLFRCFG
jgi:hypothetical protein